MVGEFPELQGVIGGYLARAQGERPEVADAIRDHYKPVGHGDEVPTAPVTVAVSLADKLDTIMGFFAVGEKPTGSKDPFALRRAALGIIAILIENGIRFDLAGYPFRWSLFFDGKLAKYVEDQVKTGMHLSVFGKPLPHKPDQLFFGLNPSEFVGYVSETVMKSHQVAIHGELLNFLADRLKVQQRDAGVRYDLIDAVFALGREDDLVRLLARVEALQQFVETPEGADLLAAYKRAGNILKKEKWGDGQGIPQTGDEDPHVLVEESGVGDAVAELATASSLPADAPSEERALAEALDYAEPKAIKAIVDEEFTAAMAALATLRGPIDAFFDKVTVNNPDADIRARRLNLLARFRDAVNAVADFSKVEG
jgi:glycyl-tRNA synthetase beta chain